MINMAVPQKRSPKNHRKLLTSLSDNTLYKSFPFFLWEWGGGGDEGGQPGLNGSRVLLKVVPLFSGGGCGHEGHSQD